MHAHNDVYAYLTVFVRSPNDQSLVAAAALILTSGCVLFVASFLGLFATWRQGEKLLMTVGDEIKYIPTVSAALCTHPKCRLLSYGYMCNSCMQLF